MSQFKYEWHKKFTESGLKPLTKLVGYACWDDALADGSNMHPGHARLAQRTGLSVMTIRRHLDVLRETGWLVRTLEAKKTGRRDFSDVYQLSFPAEVLLPQTEPVFPQENTNQAGPVFPQENSDWDEPVFPQENTERATSDATSVLSDTELVFSEDEPVFSQENNQQGLYNKGLQHLESSDSTRPTLRAARAGSPPVQPPLMQSIRTVPPLGPGQPRVYLEAKLGHGLFGEEERLASDLHARGKSRHEILSALQSFGVSA